MKYVLTLVTLSLLFVSCADENDLYSKAKTAYANQNFEQSVEHFKAVVDKFPDGKHRSEAVFMVGYISANDLKDLTQAKEYYTMYINSYPDSQLVSATEYELETLGQDINSLPMFQNTFADSSADNSQN